jgi:hypothetical protein
MSDNSDNTEAGAVDDDALERAKENKEEKESQLKKIFEDNKTGRYSGPTDS